MNKYFAIIIAFVLFSTLSFAIADDGEDDVLEIDDSISASLDSDLSVLEADVNLKASDRFRSRPALAFYGQGYAVDGTEGAFVNFVGVQKTFVNPEDETGETHTYIRMKIGNEAYGLERSVDELDDEFVGDFDVYHKGDLVGKANLVTKQELDGKFTIKSGEISVEEGTWQLSLASDIRPTRKERSGRLVVSEDSRIETEVEVRPSNDERESFLKRLFNSFRRDRSGSNSGTG